MRPELISHNDVFCQHLNTWPLEPTTEPAGSTYLYLHVALCHTSQHLYMYKNPVSNYTSDSIPLLQSLIRALKLSEVSNEMWISFISDFNLKGKG